MKRNLFFCVLSSLTVCLIVVSIKAESDSERLPDPCEASCFDTGKLSSRWNVSGFLEGTIRVNQYGAKSKYVNGEHLPGNMYLKHYRHRLRAVSKYVDGEHFSGNGDVFSGGNSSTNFNVNQLWLFAGREMDCSKGFDWGANLGMCFGMDGPNIAKWHDQTFDNKWGSGDYGLAFNNLKVTAGYKKLKVDFGIIGTPLGWENTESWDNFFSSAALSGAIAPTSHLGFLAEYEVNDRLTLRGGWSNGYDNGGNRFHDSAFVGGFDAKLTSKLTLGYNTVFGREGNGQYRDGSFRYGEDELTGNIRNYIHFLYLNWDITDRFYWMIEWSLGNLNSRLDGVKAQQSGYGINNYLVYTLNDQWSFGTRIEWFRDNIDTSSSYNEVSFGLNWLPYTNIKIRPELRYDWVCGPEQPFNNNTEKTQCSAGMSLFYQF